MTKILVLVLCLISSPVLAQTHTQALTADDASVKKIAKELAVCSSFFELVSFASRIKTLKADLNRKPKCT